MYIGSEPTLRTASASRAGTRRYNCDATVIWETDARTAAVVVDGIGNSREVADTARLLADVAARVAAHRGGLAGMLSAGELLRAPALDGENPDAVAVVAVAYETGTLVYWAGDARAYGWDGDELRQYTTDHTVGQQLRDNGVPLEIAAEHDNWIRSTMAHLTVASVFEAEIDEPVVLLTSDGVHDQVPHEVLVKLLRQHRFDLEELAKAIVAAAEDRNGYRDDATVIVLARA